MLICCSAELLLIAYGLILGTEARVWAPIVSTGIHLVDNRDHRLNAVVT